LGGNGAGATFVPPALSAFKRQRHEGILPPKKHDIPRIFTYVCEMHAACPAEPSSAHISGPKNGFALYASTPGAKPCAIYEVSLEGLPLPVEDFCGIGLARFCTSRAVEVRITNGECAEDFAVSPHRLFRKASISGTDLLLSLRPGEKAVVSVNRSPHLLLFADAPEKDAPIPGDTGVTNLEDFLPTDRRHEAVVTSAFQRALDAVSEAGGGTLFVPNGEYRVGQLRIGSNVHLHLESGALIRAEAAFTEENYPRQGTDPLDSAFLYLNEAQNVRISGRGIIDGNGLAVRQSHPLANVKLLRTRKCANIAIEGVYFRNSSRWSLHTLHSERVSFRGIKLINDVRGEPDEIEKVHKFLVSNTDGVDIDASHDVLVEDSFIYTGDDAISVKVTNYMDLMRPAHHVVLRNNVLWTFNCAIRLGNETRADIHDVLFENNDILRADRAIALYSGDGGRIFDFTALDNRSEFIGGDYNERLFLFDIHEGRDERPPGVIENVAIRNFHALLPAPRPSTISGYSPASKIRDVRLANIVIAGRPATRTGDIPLQIGDFAERISLLPLP
jgi:hypothetical protein